MFFNIAPYYLLHDNVAIKVSCYIKNNDQYHDSKLDTILVNYKYFQVFNRHIYNTYLAY